MKIVSSFFLFIIYFRLCDALQCRRFTNFWSLELSWRRKIISLLIWLFSSIFLFILFFKWIKNGRKLALELMGHHPDFSVLLTLLFGIPSAQAGPDVQGIGPPFFELLPVAWHQFEAEQNVADSNCSALPRCYDKRDIGKLFSNHPGPGHGGLCTVAFNASSVLRCGLWISSPFVRMWWWTTFSNRNSSCIICYLKYVPCLQLVLPHYPFRIVFAYRFSIFFYRCLCLTSLL